MVFWSFFRFRGYFGHFLGLEVFWSFSRFQGYIGKFSGFDGILVNF